MNDEEMVWVFGVADTEDEEEDRGLFDRADRFRYGRVQVSAAKLRKRLEQFLGTVKRMIEGLDVSDGFGDFTLDQVSLTVEITTTGKISLIGSGGEVAGKGGMTLTLARRKSAQKGDRG